MLQRNGGLVRACLVNDGYKMLINYLDIQPQQAAAFRAEFLALDQLTNKFQTHMTPLNQFQGLAAQDTHDRFVTFSLAYSATVQLHKNFALQNATSNQKCLTAASAVVIILSSANLSELACIDPIMGVSSSILFCNICIC
jgi:hypothetical protein